MASTHKNVISLSESERLKSLLKHPEDDLKEIVLLIEKKIEKSTRDLKESEEKFRNIADQSLMGICILQDDVIGYANQRIADISGYSLKEIMSWQPKEFYKTIVTESMDFVSEQAKKKQLGLQGAIPQYQLQIIKKSGEKIWIENFSKSINFNGKPADLVTLFDITKQKKVEGAFLREKKFTDIALNAQRDTFFIFEPSTGKAVRWNNAFKELSGYSDEEISKLKTPGSYYREEDLNQLVGATELIEQGGTAVNELSLITKDKKLVPFEYSASGIFTDEGNLKYIVAIGRDITERKKIQDILKENERLLKMAQSLAHIGHFKLDTINFEVSGSDELFKIFDLNQDEATLDAFTSVVHPDDREYDLYHIRRGMETGESWNIEHRLICKDGTEKWVHAIGEATRDESGKIIMLLGTVQDITDRKKIEEVLYHERDLIRTLFENHPDFIYFKDNKARFQNLSKRFAELFGVEVEEIIGKTDLELFPEELAQQTHNEDMQVINTGIPLINKEEESEGTWVLTTKLPWYNKDGNIKGLFGISRDITDRKKVEKELKESEEKYRDLVNNIHDSIFELDENGILEYVSPQIYEFTGYKPEEQIGLKLVDLIHPDDLELVLNSFKKVLTLGEVQSAEYRRKHKDGHYVYVNSSGRRVRIGDKYKLVGTTQNITERKKVEQTLKKSEEKYSNLFQYSNDAIILHDLEGNIVDINQNARKWLGYTKSEFLIMNISQLHPSKDLELSKNKLKEIKKNKFVNFEISFKRKNGELFPADLSAKIIEIDDKTFIQGEIRDLTDKKKVEQELKESEKRIKDERDNLLNMLNSMEDGVYIINQQHEIQFVNPSLKNAFGPIENRKCYEYFQNLPDPCPWCKTQEQKKHSSIRWEWDSTITKKFYEITATPIKNADGDISKLVIFHDITEKKKAEQKLKESEEKYRNLFEKSPNAIALLDFTGKIIDCNLVTEKTFGYSTEDLKGRNYLELPFYSERMINKLKERFQTIAKAIEIEPQELEIEKKDGNMAWITTAISYFKIGEQYFFQAIIQDITEQKQAEQKLKESEEKFRTIAEQSFMGIEIIQDGKIKYVNEAASKILEFSVQEMKAWEYEDLFKFVYPEDLPIIYEQQKKRQEGKEPQIQYSVRSITKSGKIKWLEISSKMVLYQGKEAIFAIFYDITDKKKAEEKLITSEERYRNISNQYKMLLESITDAVYALNSDWEYILVNKNAENIVNMPVERLMGYKINDVFPGVENTPFFKTYEDVMNTGRAERVVDSFQLPNGHIGYYEVSVYPIKEGILCIGKDVSEERNIQQKLKESEEKFRTIAEQSLIGIGILQDDVIKYVNKGLAVIFGYSVEEMKNWPSLKFQITVHPDDRDLVLEQVRKKQLGLEDYMRQYQFRGVKKTGEIIWIDNFTQSIMYEGKPADLVTFVDITKTKKAEQELMKLDKMKADLLRRTSHELKTPLVSIKGFADLLLELHSDKLEDFVVDTITEIKQGCSRLETLIGDILKTSELEFGSVRLHKTEENLSFLIKLCISESRGFSELRKHVINMKVHNNLVGYFEKEQIHQVISNILSNAIKYTPPYGRIEIESKLKGDYIIVSIKDNGIGLTQAEQSSIFTQFGKIERFGQGYDIISEGSGLGLYISKKIIELHGGKIWVESEGRNRGAKFFFSLPIIKS